VDEYLSLLLREELREVLELREEYCFMAREVLLGLEDRSIPEFGEEEYWLRDLTRDSVLIDSLVFVRDG
jgi:hypothetical protein